MSLHNILRFQVDTVSNDFLGTEESQNKLLSLIENIEICRDHLDEINNNYNIFCEIYHNEMNKWFRGKNVNLSIYNNYGILYLKLKMLFLAANGTRRERLLQGFKNTQKQFDKEFRKTERKYKYNKMCDIDNLSTSDPTKFWKTLKNLGPHKATNISLEVVDEEGNISTYLNGVLSKWGSEFKK